MADCFISFSSHDAQFAQYVAQELRQHGLTVFLASDSLQAGADWRTQLKANLANSNWVVFLASRTACQSPWVQQELGMAVGGSKKLVPVVWDIDPSQLPGWAQNIQALDLRRADAGRVRSQIAGLAQRINSDKQRGYAIAAAILAGLVYLGTRS